MNLTPGQVVWYVPVFPMGEPVTVEKVGRKWATMVGRKERIEVATGRVTEPGYGLRGNVWESEADFEVWYRTVESWRAFERDIATRSRPAQATLENIAAARRLLGLEVSP